MERVKLNVHESLYDLVSKDGNYIDLLACDEFTLWYLLKHLDIQSFLPVIHTHCFLTKDSLYDLKALENLQLENFNRILSHSERFFNIRPIEYCAMKSTLNQFIKEGLGKNQLIYMRYDSYYDSIRGETPNHHFHTYPIAGLDDMTGMYDSIFEGWLEVKYPDLENMYKEASKLFKRNCFYFDTKNIVFDALPLVSPLWCEVYNDLDNIAKAWENEIAIFKDYQKQSDQIYEMDDANKKIYVLKQSLIFHGLMEGLHGNFIFRLNLINQLFLIDTSHFKELFLNNRKQFKMIANMFRKASIFVKDDQVEFDEMIGRIKENVIHYFVLKSDEMLEIYLDILRMIREKTI